MSLPGDVASGLERIRRATSALIAAAEAADPDAVARSIEERGRAVERLQPLIQAYRQAAGAGSEQALGGAAAELQRDADRAFTALHRMRDASRERLVRMSEEAGAIRSYKASTLPNSVLDRSG